MAFEYASEELRNEPNLKYMYNLLTKGNQMKQYSFRKVNERQLKDLNKSAVNFDAVKDKQGNFIIRFATSAKEKIQNILSAAKQTNKTNKL